MALYPLTLAITPGAWRIFSARMSDKKFIAISDKIHERDDHTCQFCGFQANEFQEIVNLDRNFRNGKRSNLVTACCFCAQCFFIESVGNTGYGGGTLIYLPELTQNQLNSLCHVLFCAMENDTGYMQTSQGVYRSLKLRSQLVEDQFGEGASAPASLAQLIMESPKVTVELQSDILKDLRLLPSKAKFKMQIEHWARAAISEMDTEDE